MMEISCSEFDLVYEKYFTFETNLTQIQAIFNNPIIVLTFSDFKFDMKITASV